MTDPDPAAPPTGTGRPLVVASCSGFLGDRMSALAEVVTGGPVDVVTGDYLAELTMLILARQQAADPTRGFARPFLRQLEGVLGEVVDRGVRVVVNAGGTDPEGCAEAVGALAARLGLSVGVAAVTGDDLTPRWEEVRRRARGLRAGGEVPERPVAAHAYLGCWGVVEALRGGAQVVVTGRVSDASLLVGAAAHAHGWGSDDLDALAGATVLGHVLECGCQATGGNYAFFHDLQTAGADLVRCGFPLAEVRADGSGVVTKHPGTGGAVTVGTVTAQLLYEIGGPRYAGPDVISRFDTVRLTDDGPDRVLVHGVVGEPAPRDLKVSATSAGGWRQQMEVVLTGLDVEAKADLVARQLDDALPRPRPAELVVALVRTGHPDAGTTEEAAALLRIQARDGDRERVGRAFSSAVVELVLSSVPGFFPTTPPGDAAAYGVFSPVLVPRDVCEQVVVHADGRRQVVPHSPGGPVLDLDQEQPRPRPGPGPEPGTGPLAAPTSRVPLGRLVGARSGDKGGDANVGLWVRREQEWPWLAAWATPDRLLQLLPEAAGLEVEVHALPALRAVNVVVRGLLGEGVAGSLRFDPQAKALGELLRSRLVDVPSALLGEPLDG